MARQGGATQGDIFAVPKGKGVAFVYTYVGLVLFLCGVNVGFAPVGSLLGGNLAQSSLHWLLIPIGMLIGWYIVKAMQFWGISLQSEKEIVAILVPKAEKMALMRAIEEHCGMQSEAQGFVLSLPVDDVVGLE